MSRQKKLKNKIKNATLNMTKPSLFKMLKMYISDKTYVIL